MLIVSPELIVREREGRDTSKKNLVVSVFLTDVGSILFPTQDISGGKNQELRPESKQNVKLSGDVDSAHYLSLFSSM